MTEKVFNVLFICTGNSARSILAESILNSLGRGRFKAFSAGSHPAGQVNPYAIELLERNRFNTASLRSKSWDEFVRPEAPRLDFIFTVCDKAAGEVCPLWPGQPMSAHWGVEDPGTVIGSESEKRQAFSNIFMLLNRRISIFLSLPFEKLNALTLKHELDQIGLVREAGGSTS